MPAATGSGHSLQYRQRKMKGGEEEEENASVRGELFSLGVNLRANSKDISNADSTAMG